MDNLKNWGIHYITKRDMGPRDAVMFDIDDTLIFMSGRSNAPIVELLTTAHKLGYKIVIITARPGIEPTIQWTIRQLKEYKIGYDYLGFTSPETKHDMKIRLPYHFVLSIGDIPTDLTASEHFLNISNLSHN